MGSSYPEIVPCVCAARAPRRVECDSRRFQLLDRITATNQAAHRADDAWEANPTRANTVRIRDAVQAILDANIEYVEKCRPCLEHVGEVADGALMIKEHKKLVEELDQKLLTGESPRHARTRRVRRGGSDEARAASLWLPLTRRLIRWGARR